MTDTPNATEANAENPVNAATETEQADGDVTTIENLEEVVVTVPAAVEEEKQKAELETQLAAARVQADEYLDGWQRARAEFANFRKRAEKELDESYQNATVDMLRKLLPIVDDFDRAIANLPADKAEDELIKGFSLIQRKLITLLEGAGLKAFDPKGEPFDPKFHEALGHEESDQVPSGYVSSVLQKGYLHGERVIRPALVRVAQ
jgi:molecular chaperone GrpE